MIDRAAAAGYGTRLLQPLVHHLIDDEVRDAALPVLDKAQEQAIVSVKRERPDRIRGRTRKHQTALVLP